MVNFNNWQDTLDCVESLLRIDYETDRILIIENGSANDSFERIKGWVEEKGFAAKESFKGVGSFGYVYSIGRKGLSIELERALETEGNIVASPRDIMAILIQTGSNLGYAGGNNVGIRHALAQGADYVWLLNNDTEVHPESLTRLVERAQEDDSIGIVGSTLLYHHDRSRVQALGGARYNRWLGVAKHIGEGRDWNKIKDNIRRDEIERQMDYVVGASMLVSRRFIEAVGLMSEDYFLYFEELDWAIRGKKKGFRLAWAPESIVYHKEGATIGSSSDPMKKSYFADYWGIRNRIVFTRKFYPWLLPAVYAGLLGSAVKRVLRGQPERAGMILKLMMGRDTTLKLR